MPVTFLMALRESSPLTFCTPAFKASVKPPVDFLALAKIAAPPATATPILIILSDIKSATKEGVAFASSPYAL